MSAVEVVLNNKHLVTVSSDGLDHLSVRVHGDRLGPDYAILEVSGGAYPMDEVSTYLTWVNELTLSVGDILFITFLDSAMTTEDGKTIEELFPDEESPTDTDFSFTDEMYRELTQREKKFDGIAFKIQTTSGKYVVGRTDDKEHGLSFSLNWDSFHPERIRASLSSHSLEDLKNKKDSKYHFQEILNYGENITFEPVE